MLGEIVEWINFSRNSRWKKKNGWSRVNYFAEYLSKDEGLEWTIMQDANVMNVNVINLTYSGFRNWLAKKVCTI